MKLFIGYQDMDPVRLPSDQDISRLVRKMRFNPIRPCSCYTCDDWMKQGSEYLVCAGSSAEEEDRFLAEILWSGYF